MTATPKAKEVNTGITHHEKCWTYHLDCAVDKIHQLTEQVISLKDILSPIVESKARAEKMGRNVDEWVEYAKKLEHDAGGAVGEENARLRTRVREEADRNDELEARNRGLEEQAQHLRGDVLQFSELANECIKELKIIQALIELHENRTFRPEEMISDAAKIFFGKITKRLIDIEKNIAIINEHNDLVDAVYDVKEREMEGWGGPKVTAYSQAVKRLKEIIRL